MRSIVSYQLRTSHPVSSNSVMRLRDAPCFLKAARLPATMPGHSRLSGRESSAISYKIVT
jgi:hypothetical protein